MFGILFAVIISVGIPLFVFVYACIKKRYIPFLLGVFAFIGSQVLIRIPLLQYIQDQSTAYSMFSVMQPVLFAVVIGLSAGIFEEMARYIMMRFFMKKQDWQSGFLFGVGHGGIEAVLFVGIHALTLLSSPLAHMYNGDFFVGGLERFFVILLHIGLSIMVLRGVVRRKFLYVVLAIVIHGIVDALVGILPLFVPAKDVLIVTEVSVAIIALAVFSYSINIRRKKGV